MRPDHFQSILGTSFITHSRDTVLRFAKGKSYDRYELAEMGVPQVRAARYLHLICVRLSITTPAQLATRLDELPTIKGIGHAAFYVALAVLASEGLEAKALTNYADFATSKQFRNPSNKDWEPVPVMLATLKRRQLEKKKAAKKKTKTKPLTGALHI